MEQEEIQKVSKMVKCECYSHLIEAVYISDPCPEAYINIWYDGRGSNTPLLERIENAWRMLTSGYVIDGVILTRKKVIELRDALTEIEQEMEKDQK